jgi:hypothetical protein
MLLLSIDVGIINLGICLYDTNAKKIRNWTAQGVPPKHSSGLFVSLRDHLRTIDSWTTQADKVIIEKQPDKNKVMKSVEHFITAYYLCKDLNVQLWDARFKVPDVVGPGKEMYAKRKKTSIIRCTEFIKENDPEWLPWFSKQAKKDDLADSLMQALSFKVIEAPPTPVVPKPRKPTINQTNSRYSKSNLAWFVRNKDPIVNTKRFEKDLKKYYSNINELLSEYNINGPS